LVCETVARRYETAQVADSQRSSDSLFKNKRSRTIAKSGGLLRSGWKAVMRKPVDVDIDRKTSRAIVRKIGKGLRESVKEDQELPANLRMQMERLRQSEGGAIGSSKISGHNALRSRRK
jgi:hypothetical protein